MKNSLLYFILVFVMEGVFSETVSVKEGESVTLSPQLPEIKKDDVIDWRFGDHLIARVRNNNNPSVYEDELDGKFRGRLKLNGQTGDLTITNFRTTDAGVYIVSNSINTIKKSFSVTGVLGVDTDAVEMVSLMEGDSVTLHTGVNEIQRDDVIEWIRGEYIIAQINIELNKPTAKLLVSANNLQLDNQTGDLKIKNIRTTDSGLYKLEINSARGLSLKTFNVSGVIDLSTDGVKLVPVLERDSVILHTGIAKIHREDQLTWKFKRDTLIAKINKATEMFSTYDDVLDGRFRERLHLNHHTGSLILTNVRPNISGLYEVDITKGSSRYTTHKAFNVTSIDGENRVSGKVGEIITLHTNIFKIQSYDEILWRFEHGDSIIAKINTKSGKFSTFDGADGIFKDSLKLDHETGSLTISKIRADHAGLYHVDITSSRHIIFKRIILNVCDSGLSSRTVIAVCGGGGVVVLLAIIAAVVYYFLKTHAYVQANQADGERQS